MTSSLAIIVVIFNNGGYDVINARYYCFTSISNNAAIADVIPVTAVVTAITLPLDDVSN